MYQLTRSFKHTILRLLRRVWAIVRLIFPNSGICLHVNPLFLTSPSPVGPMWTLANSVASHPTGCVPGATQDWQSYV